MTTRSELKISSWNTRGLNKLVKLKQVLNRIKQMKANIIFLQETHLVENDIELKTGGQDKFIQPSFHLMPEES